MPTTLTCQGLFSPARIFPIITWLPQYDGQKLVGDIISGLTVGLMVLPQGMAYASIAGLPPIYGSLHPVIAPLFSRMTASRCCPRRPPTLPPSLPPHVGGDDAATGHRHVSGAHS